MITCTNCATSYEVAASSLGPSGRSVRCARCQHVWFAANTEAIVDVSEAHRADLAAIVEDIDWVSPEWRPHLLAASVHYFHGAQSPDNSVIQQVREMLPKG